MSEIKKNRGALLTIWLVLMVFSNGITAMSYIFTKDIMASALPTVPDWAFYILGLFALLNVVFSIYLFMWKKWAFYAFCGTTIIAFVINVIIGLGLITSLSGILGPVILYLIMKPKWDLFE